MTQEKQSVFVLFEKLLLENAEPLPGKDLDKAATALVFKWSGISDDAEFGTVRRLLTDAFGQGWVIPISKRGYSKGFRTPREDERRYLKKFVPTRRQPRRRRHGKGKRRNKSSIAA